MAALLSMKVYLCTLLSKLHALLRILSGRSISISLCVLLFNPFQCQNKDKKIISIRLKENILSKLYQTEP